MKTLTKIQENAVQALLSAPRYSFRSGNGSIGGKVKRRSKLAIMRKYRKEAEALGFSHDEVTLQMSDIHDLFRLKEDAK